MGGVGPVSFLSHFVLFCQANTHTHTHTHTLLILLSGHHQGTHLHCSYITLFFLLFLEIKKTLTIICFIYSFVYLFTCLFICSFVHLFTCLFTNLFICLSFYMENVFSSTWNTT